jgi:hypothetical protein
MKQEVSDYKTRKRELDYLIMEEVKVRVLKLWDIMIVEAIAIVLFVRIVNSLSIACRNYLK